MRASNGGDSRHDDEAVARRSIWDAGAELREFAPLAGDVSADVCVVGAGIAGLSTAYSLCLDGLSVVVLEGYRVGDGQTARTTAHLASAIDDRFTRIERLHGAEGARLAGESHAAAIDRIEETVKAETIDCSFERLDGILFLGPGDDPELLDAEFEAARRAGIAGVARLSRPPFASPALGECLLFPRQAAIEPLRYLGGLARAIEKRGSAIHAPTRVTEVTGGRSARVETEAGFTVSAGAVVVATNIPINDRFVIHTKQAAYRSYAIAAQVAPGSVPAALLWDTADPYHYVRLAPGGDRVIVGGEDHRAGQEHDFEGRFYRLAAWARRLFPDMGPVTARWAGQVMETIDGLAFIGRNPGDADNVYVCTGDSGMGMTHGTIAGMLLADLVSGRDNAWTALYDPSRKPLRAALEYARENAKTVAQYGAWLGGGDADSAADIEPGQGAVYRRGLRMIAGYRDKLGQLHEMSAKCPHLGCVVSWNSSDEKWDCPCHGSRFTPRGAVVIGPARSGLEPLSPEPEKAPT